VKINILKNKMTSINVIPPTR